MSSSPPASPPPASPPPASPSAPPLLLLRPPAMAGPRLLRLRPLAGSPISEGKSTKDSPPSLSLPASACSPSPSLPASSKLKGLVQGDVVEGPKKPVPYAYLAENLDWETIAGMEAEVVYFQEDLPSEVSGKLERIGVYSAPLPSRDLDLEWEDALVDEDMAWYLEWEDPLVDEEWEDALVDEDMAWNLEWEDALVDEDMACKSPATQLEEACMALAAQEAELIEKYTPKWGKYRKSY